MLRQEEMNSLLDEGLLDEDLQFRFHVDLFFGRITWNCRSRVNQDKKISCGIETMRFRVDRVSGGRGVCVDGGEKKKENTYKVEGR